MISRSKSPIATKYRREEQYLRPFGEVKRNMGEVEFLVLNSIRLLETQAYGAEICRFILEQIGRDLALAQIYVTLRRLELKGYVSSHTTDPEPVKGGRSRRVFALEGPGVEALEQKAVTQSTMATFGAANAGKEKSTYASLASVVSLPAASAG